jgi:hypothetical protein
MLSVLLSAVLMSCVSFDDFFVGQLRCLFHSLGKSRIGRQQEGNRVQELVKSIKPLQEEPRYVPVLVWDIGWYVQK